MSVKAPRRNKAAATNTNTKKQAYRGPDGKTNIERYNDSLKGEKIVHKTVREWADIVKSREDALQARNRAESSLSAQCERTLGYQADIGRLNKELWDKRFGSFFIGAGFAFFISYLLIIFA